jgi:hypothetical protein
MVLQLLHRPDRRPRRPVRRDQTTSVHPRQGSSIAEGFIAADYSRRNLGNQLNPQLQMSEVHAELDLGGGSIVEFREFGGARSLGDQGTPVWGWASVLFTAH